MTKVRVPIGVRRATSEEAAEYERIMRDHTLLMRKAFTRRQRVMAWVRYYLRRTP